MGVDPHRMAAETLVATVGIKAILSSARPVRLTAQTREESGRLPFRWRESLRRFLRGEEWDQEPKLRDWDWEETSKMLSQDPDPHELGDRLQLSEEPDVMVQVIAVAGAALQVLKEQVTPRGSQTLLGATPSKPSDVELSRLRLVYCTLDDPNMVMQDLGAGMLTSRQVDAFRRVYPSLAELVNGLVTSELVELKTDKPNAELPRRRAAQLAVLMGQGVVNPDLARQMQAAFAAPDASQPMTEPRHKSAKPAGPQDAKDQDAATSVQKIENG